MNKYLCREQYFLEVWNGDDMAIAASMTAILNFVGVHELIITTGDFFADEETEFWKKMPKFSGIWLQAAKR